MNQNIKSILNWLLTLVVGILLGFVICLSCNKHEPKIKIVPIYDTITINKERIKERIIPIEIHDTLYRVDSVIIENDGTYVKLPMEYNLYKDTIIQDSTTSNIEVFYHGIESDIDSINLIVNSKLVIHEIESPKIHPFIGLDIGPEMNYNFSKFNGINIEVSGGLIFKNGWGGKVSYELGAVQNNVSHTVKVGVIKQF